MPGLRRSALALAASLAVTGLLISAPAASAKNPKHHSHHRVVVDVYGDYRDAYSSYDEYEATFPNTADHSAECVNGFRWQRHNHDWFKTEAQDSLPLPCR